MLTGVSSSCKLFPEICNMLPRTTGDDVGKNTKSNNKKTTVRECYMSMDIEEMENLNVCVYGGGDKNAFTLPLLNNYTAKDDSEDSAPKQS